MRLFMGTAFPAKKDLFICFSHVSYQMAAQFNKRNLNIRHVQVWTPDELRSEIKQADILVISGMWDNDLLGIAPKLRFIQSISAGYDQYPLEELRERGIRLANAGGVNRNAVAEHTMAMILGFARQLHLARDNQRKGFWRGMYSDPQVREQELGGKTLLIIGLGSIGTSVARLAKAFGMRVIATDIFRDLPQEIADELHQPDRLHDLLPQADFVVLNCPLTAETEGIINAAALSRMKKSAYLINVARGKCIDENAVFEALRGDKIAGAGLDCFPDEPLDNNSPFWKLDNVIITPHTAGETQKYEDNVIDILVENIDRLSRGETELFNQII